MKPTLDGHIHNITKWITVEDKGCKVRKIYTYRNTESSLSMIILLQPNVDRRIVSMEGLSGLQKKKIDTNQSNTLYFPSTQINIHRIFVRQ